MLEAEGSEATETLKVAHPFEAGQYKLIYAYSTPDMPKLNGMLKVGDATVSAKSHTEITDEQLQEAARKRINSYTSTTVVGYVLEHVELAIIEDSNGDLRSFRDHDVHKMLKRSGFRKYKDPQASGQEWFEDITVAQVRAAIAAVKEGKSYFDTETAAEPLDLHPHQRSAVDETLITLNDGTLEFPKRMLWNAKMRFGKTIAAYSYAKEADLERVLVITHRPDVNASWFEDFKKLQLSRDGWRYGSKRNGDTLSELTRTDGFGKTVPKEGRLLWFASIQDLRLSKDADSEDFRKNSELFAMDWDLIITDEAHEGTLTGLANGMYESLKSKRYLDLSGTPFNIIQAGEWDFEGAQRYLYDGTFIWSYPDEQREKRKWEETHPGEPNPWGDFPSIEFRTYNLGEVLGSLKDGVYPTVDLNDLFAVGVDGKFIREQEVQNFLYKLLGSDRYSKISPESFPFHRDYQDQFAHTLWMLPSVAAVGAMEDLLKEPSSGFSGWTVVNATGKGNATVEAEDPDALKRVKAAVRGTRSITLSFRMLTTGISVPEWTAVFMMSNISSPMQYMQAAFRATTPGTLPNGAQKTKAYVFDFSADRCLNAIAELARGSAKSSKDPVEQHQYDLEAIDSYLEFVSLLSLENAHFVAPDSEAIMERLNEVYRDEVVEKGFDSPKIFNFRELQNFNISQKTILDTMKRLQGSSLPSSVGDILVSDKTDDQRKRDAAELKELQDKSKENAKGKLPEPDQSRLEELTRSEAQEKKIEAKNRENGVKIITGIACRLPMLVFASNPEDRITPQNFHLLIDDESWAEFMPAGLLRLKPEGIGSFEERADAALGADDGVVYWEDAARFFDPVIFSLACERIRQLARTADTKDPLERAFRIAALFSSFKNPDKETVLTPWRVVNLQYGSTVGGLLFVDLERSTASEVYGWLEEIATGERGSHLIPRAIQLLDAGTHRVAPEWYSKPLASHLSLDSCEDAVPNELENVNAQTIAEPFWDRDELSIYDINSKTALYPLFAAASIYYRKILRLGISQSELNSAKTLEDARSLWRSTVEESIFLNCRVEYSRLIAQRVLMGYDSSLKINATVIDVLQLKSTLEWWNAGAGLKTEAGKKLPARLMPEWWKKIADVHTAIGTVLRLANPRFVRYHSPTIIQDRLTVAGYTEEGFQKLLETILLSKSQGEERSMGKKSDEQSAERLNAIRELLEIVDAAKDLPRFDLTAGNPPYQRETAVKETLGQKTVTNVFHEFQLTASELSVATSLIYPAGRWIQRSGKGLDDFGKNQLNSPNLQEVHVWTDSSELFSEVGIPDGISVVFTDSSIDNQGSWTLSHSRGSEEESGSQATPGEGIIGMSPTENSIVSKATIRSSVFLSASVTAQKLFGLESNFVEVNADRVLPFVEGSEAPVGDYIRILANDKAGKAGRVAWHWIKREDLPAGHSVLSKWKLAVSSFNTTGFNGRRPYLEILAPDQAHGRSRLTIATFGSEDEALNAARYLNTDLMRYLVSTSGDLLKSYGSNVPMLSDYTSDGENSDLFSKDEAELNLAIFEAFEITEEERESARLKVARATKLYSDSLEATVAKRLTE